MASDNIPKPIPLLTLTHEGMVYFVCVPCVLFRICSLLSTAQDHLSREPREYSRLPCTSRSELSRESKNAHNLS